MGLSLNGLLGIGASKEPHTSIPATQHRLWLNSRLTEQQVLLLTEFAKPKEPNRIRSYWTPFLGETPDGAIARLYSNKFLVASSLENALALSLKVPDLKGLLKSRGCSVTGAKAALINRLIEADREFVESIAPVVYECSDSARDVVDAYQTARRADKESVAKEILELFKKNSLRSAFEEAASYKERWLRSPKFESPFEIELPIEDVISRLGYLLSGEPKILGWMKRENLEKLRWANALSTLVGANSESERLLAEIEPGGRFNLQSASRMLTFYTTHQFDLSRLRYIGVQRARVIACDDSCDACKAVAKKKWLSFENLPELPYEGCTTENGCRCYAEGELSDLRV